MTTYNSVQDPVGLQLVDQVLTNVARLYKPEGFVYDEIVAHQPVDEITGRYPIFDPAYFYGFGADDGGAVDPRAETPEISFRYSVDTYYCDEYRRKTTITPRERSQAHSALRIDVARTTQLVTRAAVDREKRLAALLRGTDNGGSFTQRSSAVSTHWDDAANSTVKADIKSAQMAVYQSSRKKVNAIVLTWPMAYAVAACRDVQNLIQYTVNGLQNIELGDRILPPSLWGLRVIIADGTGQNTANEGQAANLSDIWGNSARFLYIDPRAQWGSPTTVYAFDAPVLPTDASSPSAADGDIGAGGASGGRRVIDRWTTADPPVEHVRIWEAVDEKVVAPDLGYELTGILASP